MDAKEFLSERKRMCNTFGTTCVGCPLYDLDRCSRILLADTEIDKYIKTIEKWSEDHPKITNGDKFREVFGSYIGINVITMHSNPAISITDDWLNEEYKEP